MSGKHNITIELGATWTMPVTWQAGDARVDLTGYTAKMHIRDREGGIVLISLSTENGRITLEDTETQLTGELVPSSVGVINITLEANGSDDIIRTTGTYDLKLYSPGSPSVETRLLRGSVTFRKAITVDSED